MKNSLLIFFTLFSTHLFAQIEGMSDEFNHDSTLNDWLNINDVEGWNAEHLEVFDINTTTPDAFHMTPYTTSWYQDYRGPLMFKEVVGNFVFTTQVAVTNRAGNGLPSSDYSLAGAMIRTPRPIESGLVDWTPGGENYIFLSIGYANAGQSNPPSPGPHFESKNTVSGNSMLEITPINTMQNIQIRIARVDQHVISMYREPGSDWVIRDRFTRNDFPDTMQMGLVTYTDWPKLSSFNEPYANSTVLTASTANPDSSSNPGLPYNPDLIGRYEFARFDEIVLPPSLMAANLSNPGAVSDSTLLIHFGYPSQPYIPNNVQYQIDSSGILVLPDHTTPFINIRGNINQYNIEVRDTFGNLIDDYSDYYQRVIIETDSLITLPHFIQIERTVNDTVSVQRVID